jgi:endonuclease YncB( thermonuclease family)
VRCGLAWWYRRYAPSDRRLERLENEARRARLGLWSDRSPVAPWEWRAGAKPATAR